MDDQDALAEQIGEPMYCIYEDHQIPFDFVTYSPDSKQLASCALENCLQCWDAISGRPLGELVFVGDECYRLRALAFSPDGKWIIGGSDDGKLYQWDASTGEQVGKAIQAHQRGINTIAFSPCGERLVTDSTDGVIRWSLIGAPDPFGYVFPVPHGEWFGRKGSFGKTAFSPSLRYCVSVSSEKRLILRNVRENSLRAETPLPGRDNVDSIAYHPDGEFFMTISDGKGLLRWNALTLEPIEPDEKCPEEFRHITCGSFSADGNEIIAIAEGDLLIIDSKTGKLLKTVHGEADFYGTVCVVPSPDGQVITTVFEDGTIQRWAGLHYGNPQPSSSEKPPTIGFML